MAFNEASSLPSVPERCKSLRMRRLPAGPPTALWKRACFSSMFSALTRRVPVELALDLMVRRGISCISVLLGPPEIWTNPRFPGDLVDLRDIGQTHKEEARVTMVVSVSAAESACTSPRVDDCRLCCIAWGFRETPKKIKSAKREKKSSFLMVPEKIK